MGPRSDRKPTPLDTLVLDRILTTFVTGLVVTGPYGHRRHEESKLCKPEFIPVGTYLPRISPISPGCGALVSKFTWAMIAPATGVVLGFENGLQNESFHLSRRM